MYQLLNGLFFDRFLSKICWHFLSICLAHFTAIFRTVVWGSKRLALLGQSPFWVIMDATSTIFVLLARSWGFCQTIFVLLFAFAGQGEKLFLRLRLLSWIDLIHRVLSEFIEWLIALVLLWSRTLRCVPFQTCIVARTHAFLRAFFYVSQTLSLVVSYRCRVIGIYLTLALFIIPWVCPEQNVGSRFSWRCRLDHFVTDQLILWVFLYNVSSKVKVSVMGILLLVRALISLARKVHITDVWI